MYPVVNYIFGGKWLKESAKVRFFVLLTSHPRPKSLEVSMRTETSTVQTIRPLLEYYSFISNSGKHLKKLDRQNLLEMVFV